MYKTLIISAASLSLLATAQAQIIFSENFSYDAGALVGKGNWTQLGSSAVNPIQVQNGRASLVATGQDVNAGWGSTVNLANGGVFRLGATLNFSAVSTGDYFLSWSPGPVSTYYSSRLFAKTDGAGGLFLGYMETANGANNYGTESLSLNQDYDVVIEYTSVVGPLNDTAKVFVNGVLYVTDTYTSATAENLLLGAVDLRQGSTSSSPLLTVDNLYIQIVPEPTSFALLGIGLAGLLIARRRS